MQIEILGKILREMYDNADANDKVTKIHLFGISYSKVLKENNISGKSIAVEAGIKESYGTEVNKGVRLAKYVSLIEEKTEFI